MHGMGNVRKFLVGKDEGNRPMEDLTVDGRKLNRNLMKQGVGSGTT
jgi:hypothetical protein